MKSHELACRSMTRAGISLTLRIKGKKGSQMSDATNAPIGRPHATKLTNLSLRLLVAVLLAGVSLWIVGIVHEPFAFVGGMLSDSCSAVSSIWEIWLIVLWKVILLASALVPPALIVWGRRKRWVILSMVFGVAASVTWYVLYYVLAIAVCSVK
jgi:magnesium-transporting ATPase (P-type)